MWVLHPDPVEQVADGGCRIWIRSSQNKISLPGPVPDSRKIFELLAPLGVTGPSRLSAQSIVNLTHDGVHDEVIRKLMAHGLQEEIKDLVDWSKPESMVRVWRTVEKAGCVVTSHIQRGAAGEIRALGIGKLRQFGKQEHIRVESIGIEQMEVDEVEVEVEAEAKAEEKAYGFWEIPPHQFVGRSPFAGEPLGLHETTLELLQASFRPLPLRQLCSKLEKVLTMLLVSYVHRFCIPVMESAEAYVVPEPFIDPTTGAQKDIIIGPILKSNKAVF
ncbi:hypothetical protein EDD15DRAFT_2206578 [Pisolithus albus]|nr:hypothetical protein EDD15DRAFT_2206578 [Pisolithus albus]